MWSGITRIRYTDVEQPTVLAGSVILDNVKFTGISTANIQDSAGTVVAANAANVPQWFQGNRVLGSSKRYLRGAYTPSGSRPNALIDGSRAFFFRSRPQYETYKDIQFFSIMAIRLGAKGDGVSDDTIAINTFLSKVSVLSEGRTLERSLLWLRGDRRRKRGGEAVVNEAEAH
ncbi:hypothetical protein B0H14DRAFT_3878615 [Mycena olivaceomarginata]|nr:hypothetical protein B0H14DRAFT_3878615 [Mycena olivaceomarginata]